MRQKVSVSQGYALGEFRIGKRRHYLTANVAQHLDKDAVRLAGSQVALDTGAGRFRCFDVDAGQGKRQAIEHAGMQGAVTQHHRVVGGSLI